MFIKIFKYDFKSVFFKLIPLLIIVPILAILTRIALLLNVTNTAGVVIVTFLNGMFILSLVITFVYCMVITIIRYVKSLFKDQGYLTHTLPVSKHSLLLSQILVAVIVSLISVIFISLNIMLAYFSPSAFQFLKELIWELFEMTISTNSIGKIILTMAVLVVSSIQSILLIFLGIALGHAHAKNKVLLSIVYCIAINYGYSLIVNIINLLCSVAIDNYTGLMLAALIEGLIAIGGAYFLTVFTMNKRLNLE